MVFRSPHLLSSISAHTGGKGIKPLTIKLLYVKKELLDLKQGNLLQAYTYTIFFTVTSPIRRAHNSVQASSPHPPKSKVILLFHINSTRIFWAPAIYQPLWKVLEIVVNEADATLALNELSLQNEWSKCTDFCNVILNKYTAFQGV